ncbi:MAG: homocysteine S-methyltransferase [Gammaproteobacteria bacterium]|nr:MAG: homocysteine S-methyltransferase [Gammaproteobacteria bacterium]
MNMFEKALLRAGPVVLDGGLATELETQGFDIAGVLWSAALLQTNPDAIVNAHRAYLDAGADCIISASYQASRMGFMSLGLSATASDQLIAGSVELACTARSEFLAANPTTSRLPIVAASVGPYGAALADGSEYTGSYDISAAELREFHSSRLEILDRSGADVLACETIPDIVEAEVLCDLLRDVATPAWIAFSCRDEQRISDGTLLSEAVALFADHPRVLAIGINCTPPGLITALIGEVLKGAPQKAVVVYPNSGETYHAANNTWSGVACDLDGGCPVNEWRNAGAKFIGGCCRTGPADSAAVRARLKKQAGR